MIEKKESIYMTTGMRFLKGGFTGFVSGALM